MRKIQKSLILREPTQVLIFSFGCTILIGTALLMLPISTQSGSIHFLDALFTATSATCVTGLMTVDAGTVFSRFGQTVIMVLMQIGGLGIMTFSTIIIFLLGKQISFKEKWMVQDSFSSQHSSNVFQLVKRVLVLSFGIEIIGLLFLFSSFSETMDFGQALFYAFFHTISGFCNAGITLFSDSLMSYKDDVFVNLTFAVLIIIGSLGFLVIAELGNRATRKKGAPRMNITFHTRVILAFSTALIVITTIMFFLMEQKHTLENEPFLNQLLISFFQAVTKTAGFVTVDFSEMAESTVFMYLNLMFIGAAPGSVGGGIKVTAFAVLVAITIAKLKNQEEVVLFKSTIDSVTVAKTISVIIISSIIISIFFMLVLVSETYELTDIESKAMFVTLLFESVSAFGTVGLSLGATTELSGSGKFLIILLMFIGRLGPLTVALAVSLKERKRLFSYSEEKLMVG